jgi:hypothetical protein
VHESLSHRRWGDFFASRHIRVLDQGGYDCIEIFRMGSDPIRDVHSGNKLQHSSIEKSCNVTRYTARPHQMELHGYMANIRIKS